MNPRRKVHTGQSIIISFLTMRKVIGAFGLFLPFVLIIGSIIYGIKPQFLGSISEYFYTNMRDIFTGVLCALSLFLLSYFGYDIQDTIVSKICGVCALGVALFPMKFITKTLQPCISIIHNPDLSQVIHYSSAGLLFSAFSYMTLVLFRKSNTKILSKEKSIRNSFFLVCGIIIISSLFLIIIIDIFFPKSPIQKIFPVLWLESIILIAFGISWLIKGQVFFKDKTIIGRTK